LESPPVDEEATYPPVQTIEGIAIHEGKQPRCTVTA
jgi:hypothetical protein